MRILLIYPPFKLEELYPGFGRSAPILPPLELAYIASSLLLKGHQVSIIDCPALCLNFENIKAIVRRESPDLVISVTNSPIYSFVFSVYPRTLELIKLIKSINPDIKTVLTGYFPTILPYETLSNRNVDFIIIGEPELTAGELCDALLNNEDLEGVAGIGFRKDDKIIINKERDFIENLDALPFPSYSMLPIDKYRFISDSPVPVKGISIRSSRGCPFNCYFCNSPAFWKRTIRSHSPEYVIFTMNYFYENYKIDRFQFHDDIFGFDRKWNLKFCDLLKKNKYRFRWDCYYHFSLLEEEILMAMKEAGCHLISLGVESASKRVLKEIKGVNKSQIEEGVRLLKRLKIKIRLFFLIGPPAETKEDIERTIKYALQLNPDVFAPTVSIPYPGSRFYEEMKKIGFIPNFNEFFSESPCNLPNFKKEYLNKMIKKSYRHFYLRPKYVIKQFTNINNIKNNIKSIGIYIDALKYVFKR